MTNEEALSCIGTIRFLQNYFLSNHGVFTNRELEDIETVIKKLKQTRWIPCSERLPEENGNYLVTVEANDGTAQLKYQMVEHYGPKWLHEGKREKVIAWMPLPEPYKAESEDNK